MAQFMSDDAMKTDVCVVVLTRDRPAEALSRALRGVASQTLAPRRVVIVDVGTDSVLSDAKEKAAGEILGCAEYLRMPGANGCDGRNAGAERCSERALCFLDDDDEWSSGKIESQIGLLTEGVAVVSSPYLTPDGPFPTEAYGPPTARTILSENTVGATSFPMLSADAFREAGGFDGRFAANQDWDLWMRVSRIGGIASSEEPAGHKNGDYGNLSDDSGRRARGWIRLIAKHLPEYLREPVELSGALWRFWSEMARSGRHLTCFAVFCAYAPVRAWCILSGRTSA